VAVDQAVDMHESMLNFLQQRLTEAVDFDESIEGLRDVLAQGKSVAVATGV